MSANSKISVIMPNYNGSKYIDKAIHSVFNQTYTNWELIIVDDCSTDDSWASIMKWRAVSDTSSRNELLFALHMDENSGSPAAPRNRALALLGSDSKYVAFLDSDDYWEKDKLEKQVKYMDHSDCGLTYHFVNVKPSELMPFGWTSKNKPYQGHCFSQLFKRNFMPTCSIMVRTSVIDELDYYQDTTLKISHDWEMWLRIARRHKIGYIPQALGTLRLYSGSTSAQTGLRREESREVVRRWRGLVPRGLYYKTLMSYYLVEVRDYFDAFSK